MTSEPAPPPSPQGPRRPINALYAGISNVSPLLVLLIYVLMIPAFGGGYWALSQQRSQQFYAPYAKLEPDALADTRAVEENLRQTMIRSFRSHLNPADPWKLTAEDVHASQLAAPSDERTTFIVSLIATRYENGEIKQQVGDPQATVTIDTERVIEGDGANRIICHLVSWPPPTAAIANLGIDLTVLFRPPPETAVQANAVCWGVAQENQFERLLAGWTGDPRALSGFFGRMVYFSATTITTVGFGDIVPLSSLARLVVGIEAVTGWVLAGLFLNAIAWRASRALGANPA
jgi:hypothetical protein